MFAFFLLFPTITFLFCYLTKVNKKWISLLFVLEVLFYCLNIRLEGSESWSGDITRYIDQVASYKYYTLKDIFLSKDYFMPLTSMFLSNVSSSKTVYILFYGLIFAVLNWMSLRIVLKYFRYSISNKAQYLFLLGLILVFSFNNINALRFSIATMFYLWCILEIVLNERKWFYLIILLTPTIHFSYWIFILIPILWFFLKNKLRVVQLFFLASFLFTTPQVATTISHYSSFFNESIASSVNDYAGDGLEVMNERYTELSQSGNLNRTLSRSSLDIRNYGISIGFFLISMMGYRYLKRNESVERKLSLVLLVFAIANIASSASNGDRFYHISSAIGIYVLFYLLYKHLSINRFNYYSIPQKYRMIVVTLFTIACFHSLLSFYIGRLGYDMLNFLLGNCLFLL